MTADRKRLNDAGLIGLDHHRARFLMDLGKMAGAARRWFVLTVAPSTDAFVNAALDRFGIERWMPVAMVTPPRRGGRGTDARPTYAKPVFPGYLFVRVEEIPETWAALLAVKGVQGVLGGAMQPSPVADAIVETLRDFLASDPLATAKLTNAVKAGDTVCVTDGPFASFPGIVDRVDGKGRALIDVLIFGRTCPVEVSLAKIAKVT